MSSSDLSGVILGMGNPLLDISAVVPTSVLDKYEVKLNNACLAEAKHMPLYEELVRDYSVEYIAGGATQNSIRVAQWMLQSKGATSYTGCVGDDKFGKELKKAAEQDGVNVPYLVDQAQPTGTCAVLIVDKERSLIANLGAANHFKPSHLETAELQSIVEKARIFYSAGFFLTVSPPALMKVAEHVHANQDKNKVLAINLSAPFITQFFTEPLLAAIEYADYVFGNESEAEAFGEKQGYSDKSVENVAIQISLLSKKNQNRPRTVVITQGSKCTVVAINGKVQKFDVPALASELIVDVNGAGDAFVGGFLSQLAHGKELEKCVNAGHYAARTILQVSGTVLKGTPDQTQF